MPGFLTQDSELISKEARPHMGFFILTESRHEHMNLWESCCTHGGNGIRESIGGGSHLPLCSAWREHTSVFNPKSDATDFMISVYIPEALLFPFPIFF